MNTIPHPSQPVKRRRYVPTDPLIRAARRAYLSSDQYVIDQLLVEESRWKRKVTIASNKLAEVRERINKFAKERCKEVVK